MVTPFPTLNGTQFSNPVNLITYASNTVPNGFFGVLLLILIVGVALRSLDQLEFQKRLLASLAAGFIASVFLVTLGVMDIMWLELMLVLTMIAWFLNG